MWKTLPFDCLSTIDKIGQGGFLQENECECSSYPSSSFHTYENMNKSINLKKVKVLRMYSLHGEHSTSVLLKLFINGIERCHASDAP